MVFSWMNLSSLRISLSWSKYELQTTLKIGKIAYLKLIWGQYGFEVKIFQGMNQDYL